MVCRLSRRTAWAAVLGLCSACVSLATAGGAQAAAGSPRRFHPDLVRHLGAIDPVLKYRRTRLADDSNAYPLWAKAAKAVNGLSERSGRYLADDAADRAFWQVTSGNDPFPRGEAGSGLRRWLRADERALTLLDMGIERGRCQFPDVKRSLSSKPPELDAPDRYSLALLWRMKLAKAKLLVLEGKADAAADELFRIARMNEMTIRGEGGLCTYLHGITGHNAAMRAMRWLAGHKTIPEATLERLVRGVGPYTRAGEDLADVFRCTFWREPIMALDWLLNDNAKKGYSEEVIESMLREIGAKAKAEAKTPVQKALVSILVKRKVTPLDVSATLRLTGSFWARAVRNAGRPWAKRDRKVDSDLADYVENLKKEVKGTSEALSSLAEAKAEPTSEDIERLVKTLDNVVGKQFAGYFSPSWDRSLAHMFKTRTEREATRATLAIRLYERRHAELPSDLQVLVAKGILSSVPTDYFARKPLRYSKDRRLLWSVGPNEMDDGGVCDREYWKLKDIVWDIPEVR